MNDRTGYCYGFDFSKECHLANGCDNALGWLFEAEFKPLKGGLEGLACVPGPSYQILADAGLSCLNYPGGGGDRPACCL